MISRPNLNKPRIRSYHYGGHVSVTGGKVPSIRLFECYGVLMLFGTGRSRIQEVSVIGNTVQEAYENFMRIYGKYYPEQRNTAVSTTDAYPEHQDRDRPHDTQTRKLDNYYSCELRDRIFRI